MKIRVFVVPEGVTLDKPDEAEDKYTVADALKEAEVKYDPETHELVDEVNGDVTPDTVLDEDNKIFVVPKLEEVDDEDDEDEAQGGEGADAGATEEGQATEKPA